MAKDLTIPQPNLILELLEAFRRSKTMFAAVSLGVFDALENGPATCDELSTRLKCDRMAMATLLNSCVALGLLRCPSDAYSNTPESTTYLCSSSPLRMTGYINYSNQVIWSMWANLEDAIREGTHRWKQTFDNDGPIFSQLFKTEASMNEFLMGMNGFGMITSPPVANAFDLSRFHHLVDLGGATGHLAIAVCKRYPKITASIFDLPKALGLAKQMASDSDVSDRLTIVGGDFFTDPLPSADLYALGRIIHDWEKPKIEFLLRKVYDALPLGGGLLIGEKILDEDHLGPRWALMQSLNMLVCTDGTERSLSEYSELLEAAGFQDIAAVRTNVPLDAILAIKQSVGTR